MAVFDGSSKPQRAATVMATSSHWKALSWPFLREYHFSWYAWIMARVSWCVHGRGGDFLGGEDLDSGGGRRSLLCFGEGEGEAE